LFSSILDGSGWLGIAGVAAVGDVPGFAVLRVVQFAQTVLIVQRIVGGVARQADDPLAQAVQRIGIPVRRPIISSASVAV
jgi:hypothetical protein